MSKVTLTDITSGYGSATKLNANNTTIEQAFDNTLSRDGSSPNDMEANLDMNSHKVINLAAPEASNDAARWVDVTDSVDITGLAAPSQTGNEDKALFTDGSTTAWRDTPYIPETADETTAGVTISDYTKQPGDARRYGATGDGVTDDTDALIDMFAAMQEGGYRGRLGELGQTSTYKVRAGEWVWASDSTTENLPGPNLDTYGKVVISAISGSGDEPLLYIHNESTTGGWYVTGGYIGDLVFDDQTGDTAPNRHGLQMYGVQFMDFGFMYSENLLGDLIHLESKGNATTADAWHILSCRFKGAATRETEGWAFNNNSVGQVFNGSYIQTIWALSSDKGAFKGPGSGNTIGLVSVSATGGWALDLVPDVGSTQRLVVHAAEIDAPENGIRISGLQDAKISARITQRRSGGVTSPTNALLIDEVVAGQVVTGLDAWIIHRIDPTVTAEGEMSTVTTSFGSTATVNYNVVRQNYSVTGFTPSDSVFAADIHASAVGNEVYLKNKLIHDTRIKNRVRAYGAGGNIANANYAAVGSVVPFSAENLDDGGNYDTTTYEYTAPYTGFYLVKAQIRLAVADATLVRMAIMSDASIICEKSFYANGASAQNYEISCQDRVAGGSTIWISATQGTGGAVAMDAGSGHSVNNRFEVAPLGC